MLFRRAVWTALFVCASVYLAIVSPAHADGVHVRLDPATLVVQPGDTFTVNVNVFQADEQFNAFDLHVLFDSSRVSFVPTTPVSKQLGPLVTSSCNNVFHIFTPTPTSVIANVSLLCNNTYLTGPGVIYILRFRARSTLGTTMITWGPLTLFYRAGIIVSPLELQPMTVSVGQTAVEPVHAGVPRVALGAPRPNPRRGARPVTVPFDLPRTDTVELNLFDVAGRRVAHRDPELFAGGRHAILWRVPAIRAGRYALRLTTGAGDTLTRTWTVIR
jgi:hypothetical protein